MCWEKHGLEENALGADERSNCKKNSFQAKAIKKLITRSLTIDENNTKLSLYTTNINEKRREKYLIKPNITKSDLIITVAIIVFQIRFQIDFPLSLRL